MIMITTILTPLLLKRAYDRATPTAKEMLPPTQSSEETTSVAADVCSRKENGQ
jgi:hypothetical protein